MRAFERLTAGLAAVVLGLATVGTFGGTVALAAEPPVFVVPAGTDAGGTLPQHLAAADVDGDGNVDVASANQGPMPLFGATVGVGLGIAFTHWLARAFVNEYQRFPVVLAERTFVGAVGVVLLAGALAGLLMRRRLDRR